MKHYDAQVNCCLYNINELQCLLQAVNSDYLQMCANLTDGHEAGSMEWFESADREDMPKLQAFHTQLVAANDAIMNAKAILETTRMARCIEVNNEIERYEEYANYQPSLFKFPTISVVRWDSFTNEDETTIIECHRLPVNELRKWDAPTLFRYIKDNCVGKCNTCSGTPEYFIPRIKIGALSLSLQVNYIIWSYRTDKFRDGKEVHEAMITEREFDDSINYRTYLDVRIGYDERRVYCGQMNVCQVEEFLMRLADGHVTIEDY